MTWYGLPEGAAKCTSVLGVQTATLQLRESAILKPGRDDVV